ncbi:MAG: hypothetical protein MJ246_02750 [Clostridia bacterium]|nr:hypothetical protein [Clostridia bacterium]
MKKLIIVTALLCVFTTPKLVYASDIEPEYEEYDSEYIYNDMDYDPENNLDEFDAVSQFDEEITEHKNSAGKKWNDRACVATSVSLMIVRKAYLEGFSYGGDLFSDDAVIDVLKEISNQSTMFVQREKDLCWTGYCTVSTLTRDGMPYNAQIQRESVSEENLEFLLKENPEGILVLGRHNSWKHGVLVTKSFGDGTYEVYDSATGNVECREYNYLNGYKNSSKTYQFASLVSGLN